MIFAHKFFCMGYRRSLRVASNATISPSPLHFTMFPSKHASHLNNGVSTSSGHSIKSIAGSAGSTGSLWSSSNGIRFSQRPEPKPLYPELDLSRYLHIPSIDSRQNSTHKVLPPKQARFSHSVAVRGSSLKSQEAIIASVASNQLSPPVPDRESEDIAEEALAATGGAIEGEPAADNEIIEPPLTSLSFNISSEQFHAARAAAAGSPDSFWSHTMYEKPGDKETAEKVKVHYCLSKHTMEYVCKKHFIGESVLGFDLEWIAYTKGTSGPRENVSLIQIASPNRIGLFHIAMFPNKDNDFIGPVLRQILEDPNVSKVGVNIRGDCTRVRKYLGVNVHGIFELSHLYKVVKFLPQKRPDLINKTVVSMAKQVEDQLRLPLYKGQSVRESNWMQPLNQQQLKYSASDAYAGLQLYHVMDEKRKALDPCPPRPYHVELELPIPLPKPPVEEKVDVEAEDDSEVESEATEPSTSRESLREVPKTSPKPKTPRKASSTPSKSRTPTPKSPASPVQAIDSRISAAELKLKEYRSLNKATVVATPAHLRSYYIWYDNEELKPVDIAKMLRDPPLLTTTVVGYILGAIKAEKLPYSKMRLSNEVMPLLHPQFHYKYMTIVQECKRAMVTST